MVQCTYAPSVVQCPYAPTLVHKSHGTLNQHSALNHYISLNQHSFGFHAMHLCTIFCAMPLCTNFGAQITWYFKSAQCFKSLDFFKSAQFCFWCNAPMHKLWCNTPMHQLWNWCTNVMVIYILTLLFDYPDIHFLVRYLGSVPIYSMQVNWVTIS